MKLNRRRVLMTTAAGALVGAASRAFSQPAAPIRLTVQYAWPKSYDSVMQNIAAQFAAVRPDVHVEFMAPATDYVDLLQRILRAAITGGMPDVAIHGMNNVDRLAERKLITPLRPLIATEKNWSEMGYSPSILSMGDVCGDPFCMPFTIAIKSIYYNLDLVKRAGGDPDKLPNTWGEIIELQRKIQGLGGGVLGLYADYYFDDNFTFQSLIQTQGGTIATPDGRVAFGGKEGLQALQWLQGFGQAGMIDMTVNQAYASFTSGMLGILVASSSRITQLTKDSGGLFPMKVVAFPRSINGTVPGGGGGVMIHAKTGEKLQAAWDFAKFATGPVGSTEVVEKSGYIPGNSVAINDPRYLKSFYDRHPPQRAMVDQMPFLTKWYNWPGDHSLKILTVTRDYIQQVATLKQTPEAVLPKMVSDLEALLKA
ncbi:multiple sugar transport system substrate-binding protein [Bradyrhizobium sp. CIR48]|uniref:extracellular solute-binding protein n=1 Tax=Bradyrhizobium sp. CIR48 TaxID=2663840 RepID=UPI001606F2FB|nr:extracellular solute-binding protein [Bradyrhizobium sp. CIR48]MBB4428301.1 multiple sugar transport system substrate-binding protein [Bradyrhizobium sp. CIR48]